MYDLREGTQIRLMVMISTYLNHHDHLRSLSFDFLSGFKLMLTGFLLLKLGFRVAFSFIFVS
jgi:hypothetical protein